jgi:hypothetical protein
MRRRAAVVVVVLLSAACGREGPIIARPTNAPLSSFPPIAIPPPPEPDDRPVVWTERSDKVAIRVVMKPGRPIVGEPVGFDIKMSYGEPPYRPGGFAYNFFVEGGGGESLTAACTGAPIGVVSKPSAPKPFDDNLRRTYAFFDPGSHRFSMSIFGMCASIGGVSIERSFTVRGTRPTTGLHRTGSDGQRQVDLLITPAPTKVWRPAHMYAIFEDRTGQPFSWRVSFGDGRRPIVGGPACKRGTSSRNGRYERKFVHAWDVPAEYRLRVELAASCLADPRLRGARVIDDVLFVRPYAGRTRGTAPLPAHRFPPLHSSKLGPVKLVVGDDGCVSLERPDGRRLQVVFPVGSRLIRKPRGVTLGYLFWPVGKIRKDVRVLGGGSGDAIPERCRFSDEALLLAPLD